MLNMVDIDEVVVNTSQELVVSRPALNEKFECRGFAASCEIAEGAIYATCTDTGASSTQPSSTDDVCFPHGHCVNRQMTE